MVPSSSVTVAKSLTLPETQYPCLKNGKSLCLHLGWLNKVMDKKHLEQTKHCTNMIEFQLSYSKSQKMMLWKCCTQYASKFGKLSSGHRTGKGPFSSQSQRKAMPKNAQTTTQLHSSHTLVKECSKFSKPGFSNMWAVNFLMFKLVLEKPEEPEIKLPTSTGSSKKQESSRKTSISALLTMPKPWLCGSQSTVENSERDGNTRPPHLPLEKCVCRSGSNS